MWVRLNGPAGNGDLWEAVRSALSDPRFGPGFCILFDARGLEKITIADRDLHTLAQHMRTLESSIGVLRVALLAPEASHTKQLAQHYASIRAARAYELRVFTDEALALAFLRGEPA